MRASKIAFPINGLTKVLAQCALAAAAFASPALFAQTAPAATSEIASQTSTDTALRIEKITASTQGGDDIVRIQLSQLPEQLPQGFATSSPARIAIDLPQATNGLGRSLLDLQQGNVVSANVFEAADRARVVLNLKTPSGWRIERQDGALLVVLEPIKAPAAQPEPPVAPTTVAAAAPEQAPVTDSAPPRPESTLLPLGLQSVDFRRTREGAGRIVVQLADGLTADVRSDPKGLAVHFPRAALPESLRQRLDVVDFGTPVQTIVTDRAGDAVNMTLTLAGDWEHSSYQSQNQFVIEVAPKRADPNKLAQGSHYSGERLSLNFQNIDVRALLQVIADFTNFNIITSDTVGGTLTLRLKDVPWDQALNIILEARGLGMKKTGNVLWVAPREEIDERARKELEAARALEKLEPLRTQGFQINYAKAENLLKQIADTQGGEQGGTSTRLLSERGSAIAEPRTNQLFVTDIASKLEEVQALLTRLDVPVRQVMIEARIVEATDTFGRNLGVKLGGGSVRGHRHRYNVGGAWENVARDTDSPLDGQFVNLAAGGTTSAAAASFAFSVFNSAKSRFLALELSAMESEGLGKVISNPKLLTADQTKAHIEQGTEIPYTETAPNGATTTSFKKATLRLQVTPQITPEGNIILDLDINKDSPGATTDQGIAINTKQIKTQVLVENGGTVVIGGIFEMSERNVVNKVPLLGDIPVLGHLFKNSKRETNKEEMLVFITPRMITDAISRE